jgi:hypothetical protein
MKALSYWYLLWLRCDRKVTRKCNFESNKNNVTYELLSDMMNGSSEQTSGIHSKKKGVYFCLNIKTCHTNNMMQSESVVQSFSFSRWGIFTVVLFK